MAPVGFSTRDSAVSDTGNKWTRRGREDILYFRGEEDPAAADQQSGSSRLKLAGANQSAETKLAARKVSKPILPGG